MEGTEKRKQGEQCGKVSNHEPGGDTCVKAGGHPPGQLEILSSPQLAHRPDASPQDVGNRLWGWFGNPNLRGPPVEHWVSGTLGWAEGTHSSAPWTWRTGQEAGTPHPTLPGPIQQEEQACLQPSPSSQLTTCWLLPPLGQTNLTLWLQKTETAGRQEKRQVKGSTGPLALLHARPRPMPGPTMPPALPNDEFSMDQPARPGLEMEVGTQCPACSW